MANRHLIRCGGACLPSLSSEWKNASILSLCLGQGRHDVHLGLQRLSDRLFADLPEVVVDLMELAAYVYAADQAVTRGGRVEIEYGERWRRHFRFVVPVRCPNVWRAAPVKDTLTETLSFLSDDDFEFQFTRQQQPLSVGRYLFNAGKEDTGFEEVVLFSGGLDSLGGAVREILQAQRKIVLVSHRPTNTIYARQQALVAALNERLVGSRCHPLHVAVEVNKGKPLGRDFNQRTRSFLFAAIAAIVARVFGLWRIRFYENGPVSLNLPVSPQVLGGRASRTTHPRVLKGLERLFTALFERAFRVENPFLWQTRKEILLALRTGGYGPLCAGTSSCAHTWEQTAAAPLCGRCSQCVDRRIAALAAGLNDDEDPPGSYRSDVLTAPMRGADLILAERYVGHLLQVDEIVDAAAFLVRYPEVARILRHVDETPARAAELALDLYRRHAEGVREGLMVGARTRTDPVVWRNVPVNSLLGITLGRPFRQNRDAPAPSVDGDSPLPPLRKHLVMDAESFAARLGEKDCFLGNTVEFRLLERLNRRPGRFVTIDTLRTDVWQDDRTAKNTIQRTVSNLRRKLQESCLAGVVIDGSQKDHYRLVLPG